MNRNITHGGLILAASLLAMPNGSGQSADTPQTRLRPIGSPSMVDQYRSSIQRADYRETVARQDQTRHPQNNPRIEQTVWMQNAEAPPLLNNGGGMAFPDNFVPPPISPLPPASVPIPPPTAPRSLPANPAAIAPSPAPFNPVPSNDYAPLNPPRLDNRFATLDNSCHVSGPSTYTAASASGCCAPVNYQAPPAYIAAPAPIAQAPVFAPGFSAAPAPAFAPAAPIAAAPTGVPAGSLISFGQQRYQVQVGPGLFGQPVAYVPGQKFRNWIRYVFP